MTTTDSEPVKLTTELPPDLDTANLVFSILPSTDRHQVEMRLRRLPGGRIQAEATITAEAAQTSDQQIEVEVVVNGWIYKIPATPATTLDQLIAAALAKGNHTGRPATDFEIRDAAGVWLSPYGSKTLEELNLHRGGPDTRLFLNLRAGAGG